MKIAFTIKSLAGEGGGAERVLAEIASGLVSRGHAVTVYTFDAAGFDPFYDLDPRVTRVGLNRPINLNKITPSQMAGMVRDFARHIRGEYDVAVGFMHSTYVPLAIALARSETPFIASEHSDKRNYRGRSSQRLLSDVVTRMAYRKTVPSAPVRAEYAKEMQRRIVVMHNPVDLEGFKATGREITPEKTILSVGSFIPQKDFPTLIAAFATIAPDLPDWKLRILGDGAMRPEIENAVRLSGIAERIEIPGIIRDVQSEYARASVFALSSIHESFGLVLAEALATGRPTVSFADCLGCAYLVEDGKNGILVDPGDDRVGSLADALARLLSSPPLRKSLAEAGPPSVARFELGSILDQWEELLSAAAGGLRCDKP